MKFKKYGNSLRGFIRNHNREYLESHGLTEEPLKDADEIFVGKELDLTITSLGSGGDGIAKYKSYTVVVPNTKINDKVKVVVKKIIRKLIYTSDEK